MVQPLIHLVVAAGRKEERGVVSNRETQRKLVATGVGQRHLKVRVELDHCFGCLL